ncbi:MAG: hypothetical protein IJD64_05460 [Clostridia bacterium]|nr:hypothetical protein [Clostridia bacterium]
MKKLKLMGLLAMMLVVATVLCACGTLGNLNKVFNKDFDVTEKLFKEAAEIEDLKDFALIASNDTFAVFAKEKEQKVYNFLTKEVAATYETDEDAAYTISLIAGMPAYCVTKVTEDVTSKAYYDATGANFANVEDVEKEISGARAVNAKLAIINAVAYTIDEAAGKLEEKAAVPAYVSYENITAANDEFFYAIVGGNVIVYDIDFTPVAVWNAPSYAQDIKTFVLNNGAVLAQYKVVLDEDAKKYDFHADGNKYDLVSLVISTKGNVKDVNLDYVVKALDTNAEYYDNTKAEEENAFTDKFENIAVIARIEDKMIDEKAINYDLVLMNNSGKAQQSLKMVDGQVVYDDGDILLPYKLTAELFAVETVYGNAIINNKGKVQFAATEEVGFFGGYFYVEDRAIYDLEFNVVYDLIENDAEIIGATGNTIFVTAITEKKDDAAVKTETLAFINGAAEGEVVDTWEKDGKNDKIFEIEYAIGGYSIYDPEAKTYTYYAADMTELLEVEAEIDFVAEGNDGDVAIFKVVEDGATKFYAFTK